MTQFDFDVFFFFLFINPANPYNSRCVEMWWSVATYLHTVGWREVQAVTSIIITPSYIHSVTVVRNTTPGQGCLHNTPILFTLYIDVTSIYSLRGTIGSACSCGVVLNTATEGISLLCFLLLRQSYNDEICSYERHNSIGDYRSSLF